MLLRNNQLISTIDISISLAFYRDCLGFSVIQADEDCGIASRDDTKIFLWKCEPMIDPQPTSCTIFVSEIDALYQEMKEANVIHPNGPLADQPWGVREFSILDIDGNLIRFGQLITGVQKKNEPRLSNRTDRGDPRLNFREDVSGVLFTAGRLPRYGRPFLVHRK
ncbi:bleomycin resistance protein [Pontibacter sp. G13]|uniref:bleomycin resistance protein n=1 Tax=Pontibacter sp. G13 TaxID=3074898 RepID=UPI0039062ACD